MIETCSHKNETIKPGRIPGNFFAICHDCKQLLLYKEKEKEYGTILKIGRIGEAVVLPPPGTSLDITPEESRLVREGYDILAILEPPKVGRPPKRKCPVKKKKAPMVKEKPTVAEIARKLLDF